MMTRRFVPSARPIRAAIPVVVLSAVLLVGCSGDEAGPAPSETTPTSLPPASTTTGSPAPPPSGAPTADCVSGWTTPASDDPWLVEALALVADQSGAPGPLEVIAARVFEGPDIPEIIEPRFDQIPMAYVAVRVPGTDYAGRFLVTRRADDRRGVEAVAPLDTHGWAGWSAFEGDGGPFVHDDLPGEWYGVRYDFVTGAGGPGHPGLDVTVQGCLAGT